jgi:hypothetical protein
MAGDALLRNPITGIVVCCARAASGHAALAVLSDKRLELLREVVPSFCRLAERRYPAPLQERGERQLGRISCQQNAMRSGATIYLR